MDYKIIQIIPCNKEIYANYKDKETDCDIPIVCLALIEYEDGEREVRFMDFDSGGTIGIIEECSNFNKVY